MSKRTGAKHVDRYYLTNEDQVAIFSADFETWIFSFEERFQKLLDERDISSLVELVAAENSSQLQGPKMQFLTHFLDIRNYQA